MGILQVRFFESVKAGMRSASFRDNPIAGEYCGMIGVWLGDTFIPQANISEIIVQKASWMEDNDTEGNTTAGVAKETGYTEQPVSTAARGRGRPRKTEGVQNN